MDDQYEEDDDPIIAEIPVFLSQKATEDIRLLQYPIRTANRSLEKDEVFFNEISFPQSKHKINYN